MIELKDIPTLQHQSIFSEECIAWDVFDNGVILHLIERDRCILIGWEDIIASGISAINPVVKAVVKEEEISAPTKMGGQ